MRMKNGKTVRRPRPWTHRRATCYNSRLSADMNGDAPMKKPNNRAGRPPRAQGKPRPQRQRRPAQPAAPSRSDQPFELVLEAMANGGAAMGYHDRQPIFVPYTIPGERVTARIVQDQGRFARAEGLTLLDASADRVFPRCPHFGPGRCGRCQWQHIDYAAQRLLKQDVLADQLDRIAGLGDADVRAVIPSPEQWGYNYAMTLLPTSDEQLGFLATDGRSVFPIEECHILHPVLLELLLDLDLDITGLRRLTLRLGSDGGHMLMLTTEGDAVPELETDMPTSVNLVLEDNEPVNLIGDSHSYYTVDGAAFQVTAGSSFRANLSQLPNLVSATLGLLDLQPDEDVLDLYAGVGFFSRFLAPTAGFVTTVESYPPAATDAEENLAAFDNVDIVEGSVEEVLDNVEHPFSAAVVDPPSRGISDAVALGLSDAGVERLVYISSDAASLAHDCNRLAQHGYRLAVAQPIDLNPQTYYVDTVALFTRQV